MDADLQARGIKHAPPLPEDFAPRIEMTFSDAGLEMTGYCTDSNGKPFEGSVLCSDLALVPKYLRGLKNNLWWVMHVDDGAADLGR
jgi:hypothetical protein